MDHRDAIYISCAPQDRAWRDRLTEFLGSMNHRLLVWQEPPTGDRDLDKERIQRDLSSCGLVVCLLSPHYRASPEIQELAHQIQHAREHDQVRVGWILVSDELGEPEDFSLSREFPPLHDPRRPLSTLSRADLKRTFQGIERHIVELTTALPSSPTLDLRALGVETVDTKRFTDLLTEAFTRMQTSTLLPETQLELPEAEADALRRAGFEANPELPPQEDPVLLTAADLAAMLEHALSTEGAAARLGVQPSRIRQRLNSSPATLYGIRSDSRGWRVPEFQFHGNGLIPNIGPVVAALDPGLHPVAVHRWFHLPNADLVAEKEFDESPMSPRNWLLAGLDPLPVIELAAGL